MYLKFPKKRKLKIKRTTADQWFSKYIRLRDIIQGEYCRCCTCGKIIHWKYQAECGHFVTRDRSTTRFNEQNCHAQCNYCNCEKHGEQYRHGEYIDKKYGKGAAQKLTDLGGIRGGKVTNIGLQDIAKEYRLKVKELANKKGISLK
jgi:hypothetical protein